MYINPSNCVFNVRMPFQLSQPNLHEEINQTTTNEDTARTFLMNRCLFKHTINYCSSQIWRSCLVLLRNQLNCWGLEDHDTEYTFTGVYIHDSSLIVYACEKNTNENWSLLSPYCPLKCGRCSSTLPKILGRDVNCVTLIEAETWRGLFLCL